MKTKYYYILLAIFSMAIVSCQDYLEREPQDFLSEESYFNKPSDLELFVNKFYDSFDVTSDVGARSLYAKDRNSDDLIGPWEEENLLKGFKLVPSTAGGGVGDWRFRDIRECNYFIETVESRIETGLLDEQNLDVKHYRGENYFFRAWFYFNKLQSFGDFPIITTVLSDDTETLIEASKRQPRNEVARFILEDLDKAISMLQDNRSKNRINKSTAQLLASRVALFEGTWLKYHQGTARVPGGPNWPGAYLHPSFSFEAGSIQAESNFFLEKSMNYAQLVASNYSLSPDYRGMFISHNLAANPEVLLYKSYAIGSVLGHGATHYLQRTGAGIGLTRSLVESYLMKNGLPIYAAGSNYQGDGLLSDVVMDRDERLQYSVLSEGDIRIANPDGSKEFFTYPDLIGGNGWQGVTSGYQLEKWMSTDPKEAVSSTAGTTESPIFRAAEAYLNYMEASYERNGSLDGQALGYWKELRNRAQVDDDVQKTISNTDLSKERDLAVYSAGTLVDPALYNIRRERRNEFVAEGMRLMDMYRWRSFDTMDGYIVEGFNLWDDYYKNYDDELNEGDNVSLSPSNGGSKYVQPFRKSTSNRAYNGYTLPKAHYLSAVPLDEFTLTNSAGENGALYQNPGWSKTSAIPATE
ncbi:RagB/SusD family nutrient uptake outer membrane protein [Gelidibacter salicanalis]|uniref:RagB/SusD family nutrient uptake outer membrane protein n=1 Tax=Gelidibacter salicanalis TaxID=291193 RepID=A0A934KPN2_9FLAO|nr:RagB/SusD family nutrient uptake outer membrane protein [Gelidibacter salicanalis]MBJ7879830.1 RagB/SusD family nutrient uptake outer membrane protein [Gelidibacter salicanalis]